MRSFDAAGGESNSSQRPLPQGRKTTTRASAVPALVLALVAFAVYFNALFGEFVFDDHLQIVKNPWLQNFPGILTVFSRSAWAFYPGMTITNYYRPLMQCVYTLTYQLFGLHPLGFHLVNVLFHCAATILVFLILRRLLPETRAVSWYLSAPFLAAILFATHPIHTEVVAWIAGLPDVAFTPFFLLSFYLYIRSDNCASGSYLGSLACFAVASLFKEPALTLPAILLAYDFTCREERLGLTECVKRYVPYLFIGGAYLALRVHALKGFAPIKSHPLLNSYLCALNVFPLFSQYLQKLLLPTDLNAFYVLHPVESLLEWKALLSLLVTAVVVALAAVAFKKNKPAFLGLLFIVVPLFPVLYIPAVGENTFTDRYLYLPSVGYVLLLALFLSWAGKQLPDGTKVVAAAVILLAGTYAVGTVTRNKVWQNDYTLWTDTVAKSPECIEAHNDLGIYYRHHNMPGKAIEQFQAIIRANPYHVEAHGNLGLLYRDLRMYDEALRELQAAEALAPNNYVAHYNLGLIYCDLGMEEKARVELTTALSLAPNDQDAQQLLTKLSH
ncbi:MAG TPA: tetratricopeptide repeat protein [candidate division Zixibacteria bacterium]|nr:tetratricopeptide repeat protein [candidate division Zixibacteria bacterium]